jgi:hypothetical protein
LLTFVIFKELPQGHYKYVIKLARKLMYYQQLLLRLNKKNVFLQFMRDICKTCVYWVISIIISQRSGVNFGWNGELMSHNCKVINKAYHILHGFYISVSIIWTLSLWSRGVVQVFLYERTDWYLEPFDLVGWYRYFCMNEMTDI